VELQITPLTHGATHLPADNRNAVAHLAHQKSQARDARMPGEVPRAEAIREREHLWGLPRRKA
jgi:hypothetical protein